MSLASPLGVTFGKRSSVYLTSASDYRKYRQKVNKELLRLRHDLNIVTRDTKNYSQKEKTSSISPELYESDDRYGKVLLLLAERNLVHSFEIKSVLEISGDQIPGYKKLMTGKLKQASIACKKLLSVVKNEPDDLKLLEFYVYAALVHGLMSVNKKQWRESIFAFSVARIGLEFLGLQIDSLQSTATAGGDFDDSVSENLLGKTVIDELLDTLVDPSLNLALSQNSTRTDAPVDLRTVARKHAHDDTLKYLCRIIEIVSSKDEAFVHEYVEEDVPKSVTWRHHEASIYNDELALKLHKINQADWKKYKDSDDYDAVYSQWSTLVDLHQVDLERNKDEDDVEKTQEGAILLTYLKYHMLFSRVKRDLVLIEQLGHQAKSSVTGVLATNKDIVRLYDSIIGTIEELEDLPGVHNDEELTEALEDLSKFFTIKRSAVIADCYAAVDRFPEALKIYSHIDRSRPSDQYFKIDKFPYEVASNDQASRLSKDISLQVAEVHTMAQLHRDTQELTALHVADNIFKFPMSVKSLKNITNADKRGVVTPVLSKAVLFDIGFNYIGFSNGAKEVNIGDEGVVKTQAQNESNKKSGFFGIFGRN